MSKSIIRVLIVDDNALHREQLGTMLSTEADIVVVGGAESGFAALEMARNLPIDVALIDLNMPDMDGIIATERLTASNDARMAVIIVSVQAESDYMRRAMRAGASEYLVKPCTPEELITAVRRVSERREAELERLENIKRSVAPAAAARARNQGIIAAMASARGGVGRTTLAINVAVGAAGSLGGSVVLVDGHLQFGDISMLLNLDPKQPSMAEICQQLAREEAQHLEPAADELLDRYLVTHPSGIRVLLAPADPAMAEFVTRDLFGVILRRLRARFPLVVVDLPPVISDTTLTALDLADVIYLIGTSDVSNIRGMRIFLNTFEELGYSRERIKLVLNRAEMNFGIPREAAERSVLRRPFDYALPSDIRVTTSMNQGTPFLRAHARTPLGGTLSEIADQLSIMAAATQT